MARRKKRYGTWEICYPLLALKVDDARSLAAQAVTTARPQVAIAEV